MPDEWGDQPTPAPSINDPKRSALAAELQMAIATNADLRSKWDEADRRAREAEARVRELEAQVAKQEKTITDLAIERAQLQQSTALLRKSTK